MMLVDMERSYITAGFFRHTMYKRHDKIKEQAMGQGTNGPPQMGGQQPGMGGPPQGAGGPPQGGNKNFFPAFGNKEAATSPQAAAGNDSDDDTSVKGGASGVGGGGV